MGLAVYDYDFSSVPSDEVDACLWYEFGRESRALISEIESLRAQTLSQNQPVHLRFCAAAEDPVRQMFLMMLSGAGAFPLTPWQSLPQKERQRLVKQWDCLPEVATYFRTADNPALVFNYRVSDTKTIGQARSEYLGRISGPHEAIKTGFFAINMKYGRDFLMKEFGKVLNHFEGKPMLEPAPKPDKPKARQPIGRKSRYDILNTLGAMRLRHNCTTFAEAKTLMLPLRDKPHGLFYEHRRSFNRRCDSILIYFSSLFGWLDPAKPIHYTEQWGAHKSN